MGRFLASIATKKAGEYELARLARGIRGPIVEGPGARSWDAGTNRVQARIAIEIKNINDK